MCKGTQLSETEVEHFMGYDKYQELEGVVLHSLCVWYFCLYFLCVIYYLLHQMKSREIEVE